ncbi:cbb3-type cytochrome c oxidase subunit I [Halosimplex pelagicum]|uniref:Cbb3-type cytochrome c oxidase subunit I n=1 Tax=Halosimplex pelagicum TaxID=869886 RepID=A0A7D5TRS2_9EURY|nr:cbb3-type cytochrome c oxidase subunit I [Halosimplex pelagicum]QLH81492.1 cbb3-type cytochrome c oxidase subunit I [Halosimplex pelagicum]
MSHGEAGGHEFPPMSSVKRWFVTTNHKDIGILYTITALFFLVLGGVLAMLMRVQLWSPGGGILSAGAYNQAVSAHGLLMVFWFISPFAFGFANYLVPLQIGADDLAFPRLNAMSYWAYLFSGLLFIASFFQGGTFDGGWTMYAPLNLPTYMPNIGGTTVVLALIMFVAAVTMGSVNFLTTMYRMRAEGLRMRDLPMFSMSILLTVWMMLFAFAALLAALMILAAERLFGVTYFAAEGGTLLWTHLFWFFGHPEVYIVFFPALGIMAECFQTFTGQRIVGRKWFVLAMVLVALQSFVVWMHHMFLTGINLEIKTLFMVTTIGISLPFDLMVFSLIYTMIKGRIRFTTPFLFSLGALILFIIGGITGVFLGAVVLDYEFRGTYWVVAHFHYVMVGGATGLFAGVYYWFPKMTGRMYDEFLGKVHFALYFVGFNLLYFPLFVAWETPRRVFDYAPGLTSWHQVASVGGFILGASFLVMFYNLFKSMATGEEVGDNPWEYSTTAEWAVSSPPPLENFPGKPSYAGGKLTFRDEPELTADGSGDDEPAGDPSADAAASTDGGTTTPDGGVRAEGATASRGTGLVSGPASATPAAAGTGAAHGDERHADHASFWPFVVCFAGFLTFLGVSGVQSGGAYLGLTAVGGVLSAVGFVGLANESFYVPEPTVAEQWPFGGVENMKLGMWTFLASDVVLFGGFVGSYLFLRVANGWMHWHHAFIPEAHVTFPGLVNTYLLLASSFAVVLSLVAAHRNSSRGVVASLTVTWLLGVGFLINKGMEWQHLFHISTEAFPNGWNVGTNVASSTFYLTTGLHGAHVVVGLVMLLYMIPRAWKGAYLDDDSSLEYFGLYWHFVDIVWLFLFPLFYIL